MRTWFVTYRGESHCRQAGFSLVELLIVMALLGVMLAIAITGLRTQLPGMRMNGAARDIVGRLMMERLKAIQNNGVYGVSFTPGLAGSYVQVMNNGTAWVNDGTIVRAPQDVTIAVSGATCSNNRTEFYQDGTVQGCDTITVTSGDNQRMTVTIDDTAGNVQVQ